MREFAIRVIEGINQHVVWSRATTVVEALRNVRKAYPGARVVYAGVQRWS